MDDVAQQIIEADKSRRSWREKLDFVREWLAGQDRITTGQLVDIAIYLRFLGAGQIRCDEDGRHFRPSHHAGIASAIQEQLSRYDQAGDTWIVRKIYPALPSTARAFQRAEPLTRIRDIAHRNDIPRELKTEIKTTLQNKLHRCAGPEDLATSVALLERITAPGANYSPDFVGQFKIFHEELREFFNARSLDEQLNSLRSTADDETARLIGEFLAAMAGKKPREQLRTLRCLTDLRKRLLANTKTNAENAHECLLADIALEDFAFVLLSEFLNAIQNAGAEFPWEMALDALALTMTNLVLSSIDADECEVIESELAAWRADFRAANHESLLRVKATVERARRVAEAFSNRIAALFPPRAETLGRGLGVDDRAIQVFSEAEIRGHLVFQLSKLATLLLRHIRESLGLPAWDVIVAGRASGRVEAASRLDNFDSTSRDSSLVILKQAEGDEEIPRSIRGIVLAHELPHLSHLGVRARQAGVVLVACEDAEKFQELEKLNGRKMTLIATADQFELGSYTDLATPADHQLVRIEIPQANLSATTSCIPLTEASAQTSGGKVSGAKALAELAGRAGAEFKTPPALVAPFGVMENALARAPQIASEYRSLASRINDLTGAEFTDALERLRGLIERLSVPDEIVSQAEKQFGAEARLMVRSSANCEDLEQLAGAGLYDSVANVAINEIPAAMRKVWASLWTRRATLSRKQAGIPHDRAHMAILIQRLLVPELSFVLHTTNPGNGDPNQLYAEIAVGLGETLASAAEAGNPCRLVCNKNSGDIATLSLASFSHALQPDERGGVARRRLNYSQIQLSRDASFRNDLGKRLIKIARQVEVFFQRPQDIEGVVIGNEFYLVQSRAQQGLESPATEPIKTDSGSATQAGSSGRESARTSPKKAVQNGTASRQSQPSKAAATSKPQTPVKNSPTPLTLGLFEKRIDGDDCLMELARLRFQQARMGAEMHADTPEHLDWVMKFRPALDLPVTLHLPRDFILTDALARQRVRNFAARFAGRIHGMIMHDSNDLAERSDDYIRAAHDMNSQLQCIQNAPFLFVEYAVGLEPDAFANFFRTIRDLDHIGTCIDIGHVGIRQARKAYAERHPGEDVCALKSQPPNLPALMNDVQSATRSALPTVLSLVKAIAALDKPMHFHLHDGHPLSTFSPYGVSDHLSFSAEIPLNFEWAESSAQTARKSVPPMFGPDGLFQIVAATLAGIQSAPVSFTLEIHPPDGRAPLEDAAPMFNHWRDKTNAEKMNHWLSVLAGNHRLLMESVAAARQETTNRKPTM